MGDRSTAPFARAVAKLHAWLRPILDVLPCRNSRWRKGWRAIRKKRKQGNAVLDSVWVAMRHYPLDEDFYKGLPDALRPHFER